MYIRFKSVADRWKAGYRRVIGLDGCFLKHTCKGELLTAIGRDVINQMYPIAWAVLRVENTLTWSWFLSLLQEDLELGHGARLTIILDSHKKFSGMYLQRLFWAPTTTTVEQHFYNTMEQIKAIHPEAHDYLVFWTVIPNGFQELEVRRGDESYGVNIHLKKCHNKRACDTEPVPKPPKVDKQEEEGNQTFLIMHQIEEEEEVLGEAHWVAEVKQVVSEVKQVKQLKEYMVQIEVSKLREHLVVQAEELMKNLRDLEDGSASRFFLPWTLWSVAFASFCCSKAELVEVEEGLEGVKMVAGEQVELAEVGEGVEGDEIRDNMEHEYMEKLLVEEEEKRVAEDKVRQDEFDQKALKLTLEEEARFQKQDQQRLREEQEFEWNQQWLTVDEPVEEAHTTPNGKGKEADTSATPEPPKMNKQGRKKKQPDASDSVPIGIYHKNRGRYERIFNQKMKKSGFGPNGEGSTADSAFSV
ncbi:chloramphenicol acetyltransferase-like domain-containing protein [Tanacetum coccineum]